MPTLKLPNALARELSDITAPHPILTEDEPETGWNPSEYGITEVVENRATGNQRRWVEEYELIIRTKDGALWAASYDVGLTEMQETTAFEYDGAEIEFVQVKPVPVSHLEYHRVD